MDINKKLTEFFGFDAFRDGQESIVSAIMRGSDTLAVMPTGAGKSLCYQLPAILLDGVAVVVSPLIALMKDQVDAACARGIAAAAIHSAMPWPEQNRVLERLSRGELTLIYIAPERFQSDTFREALAQTKVALLAIDEAHCISQWGHDFRPDYLEIGRFREELGNPITLALTATATPEVQQDILKQLQMKQASVIVSGFERRNLFFEVLPVEGDEGKARTLEALLQQHRGEVALVYCATRKQVDLVSSRLGRSGLVVGAYHAGMTDAKRAEVQDMFMAGDLPILVATNAFGMGVDKSDVRAIFHMNFPGSIEGYYQEAGRAGRDGNPSRCTILYSPRDRSIHEFFVDLSFPAADLVMSVWTEVRRCGLGTHALGSETIARYLSKSSRKTTAHSGAVEAALKLLKSVGHIDFGVRDGFPWIACLDLSRTRDLRVDWAQVKLRREIALRQIQDMAKFCESTRCRQVTLLKYFKSTATFGKRCGRCDRCVEGGPTWEPISFEIPEPLDVMVIKTLSAVARAQGRLKTDLIAAMLRGSTSSRVTQRHLQKLTTYGVLDYLPPAEIHELLQTLESHRLIVRHRDMLALSDEGARVMKGELPVPEGVRIRFGTRWALVERAS